jgi:hypothetical protein
MANSYLNIVSFLLTTLFYYVALKPSLNLNILTDPQKYKEYLKNHNLYLAIYLLLVIMVQFLVNISVISSLCGGSITENVGSAGLITIFPWLLIFGIVIVILIIYPGFKSAFSDVIGYYYVHISANKLLTTLLIDKDIETQLDNDTTKSEEEKQTLRKAADTIIKICGNNSILINQMVPSNFLDYWNILKPLMKKEYQDSKPMMNTIQQPMNINNQPTAPLNMSGGNTTTNATSNNQNLKQQLLDLIITRDNIGEAMWFIYTGVLLTSFVQLTIATKGCNSSPETMEKNYQTYLQQQETQNAKTANSTSTVYNMNSSTSSN